MIGMYQCRDIVSQGTISLAIRGPRTFVRGHIVTGRHVTLPLQPVREISELLYRDYMPRFYLGGSSKWGINEAGCPDTEVNIVLNCEVMKPQCWCIILLGY